MAETYDKIFREVALRANMLQADAAATLNTNYNVALIGQTELADRAIEFGEYAIDDAILNAGDRMLALISADKYSPHRTHFAGVTANLATGALIPLIDSGSKSRIGVIGDVRDASTSKKLVAKEYQEVIGYSSLTVKQSPHWYYTDNVRIWHTRTNVVCDVVIWDKSDQRTLMTQTAGSVRGACPFPQSLHEALICGALSYVFRGDFNSEQVGIWRQYFEQTLRELGMQGREEVQTRKLDE